MKLEKRGIRYVKEKPVPIIFDELVIDEGLRLDCFVENSIIVEFKAQENEHQLIWKAQIISYLKLTGVRLGFLINFHVPAIREGIKRIIV